MIFARNSLRQSAAAAALVALALAATPSLASQASLKSMSLDAQSANTTIHVSSSDKQKWDTIKSGAVQFWGHMKIDTRWPGYVQDVALSLGQCGPGQCAAFPTLWSASPLSRDYDHQQNFAFNPADLPVSSATGIAVVPYGNQILARCNQHLQADGPTKSYAFTQTFQASFSALTDTVLDLDNAVSEAQNGSWPYPAHGAQHAAHDSFQAQVVCDPAVKPTVQDVAADLGEFDVKDVKLFLTTYRNNQPGSTPGTVCPALKVTSRAQANQAGPVSMRIWRQKDNGPITSEFQQAWASYDAAKNGYFATYEKFENVGATAYFQYKTEIVGTGPFEPSDGWKDITVHCTGAGGGGLTDVPQDDADNPPAHSNWSGEVTVSDSAGARKLCPRKGQVAFAVEKDAPGSFHYRISCSNGAFFTGTAVAFNQGGVFKASAAHDLSIARTRSIQCTLQEIKANGAIATVDTDAEAFTCIKRTVDTDSNDLVADPRPNPSKPDVKLPGRIVTKAPTCGTDQALLRGKCVDKPPVTIFCKKGFEQKGKKCAKDPVVATACRGDQMRVDGVCKKKPTVIVDCLRGYHLVGKKCVKDPVVVTACKASEKLVRGHCVAKPSLKTLGMQKLKQGNAKALLPMPGKMGKARRVQ